jgi:hypothetical protein
MGGVAWGLALGLGLAFDALRHFLGIKKGRPLGGSAVYNCLLFLQHRSTITVQQITFLLQLYIEVYST